MLASAPCAQSPQDLHNVEGEVERMVHESKEDSLRQQRRDPLDDFRRCIDAVTSRHAPNVVS